MHEMDRVFPGGFLLACSIQRLWRRPGVRDLVSFPACLSQYVALRLLDRLGSSDSSVRTFPAL